MAAKPVNVISWRKGPLLLWKLSQIRVAWRKRRQGQQHNMVDLSSSGLGNSKRTASPSYIAPGFELSKGLYANWAWNFPSRKGLYSSQCGAAAVMNLGSHLGHTMSRFDNSRTTRQEWSYMESQSTADLTSLVLYPSGYIDQGNECWRKLPLVCCVTCS
jgi:hypothetical protein